MMLSKCVAIACLLASTVTASAAPAIRRYTVFVGDRPGGRLILRIERGAREVDYTYRDRGMGPTIHERIVTDEAAVPTELHVSGRDPDHNVVDEHFTRRPGQAGFYLGRDGTPEQIAALARALNRHAGRLALLPAGEATMSRGAPLWVNRGKAKRQVTPYEIAGLDLAPLTVWLDDDGELFAALSLNVILAGWESAVAALDAAETKRVDARASELARTQTRAPAHPVAFIHATLFDADRRVLRPKTTVLVDGERICAVGADGTIVLPANAEIIDVAGKTMLPGLWDLHAHVRGTDGMLLLAAGVTTIRLMAAAPGPPRFVDGRLIGPRELRVAVLDGHGKNASPTPFLVDEAGDVRRTIDELADAGFDQVKVYNSFKRSLLSAFVGEAHARGLRTSGHVPDGLKAHDLVAAGFDELQHAYMVLLEFVRETQLTPEARFAAFARQAGEIDLASPAVREFIAELARRHVDVDLTLVSGEGWLLARKGADSPVYEEIAARLPVQTRRSLQQGGLARATPGDEARYRAAFATTLKLARALHDAGVSLAVGTDEHLYGFSLERELQLLVQAGIPAADVLAADTIGAARIMRRDRELGSIAIGKYADLVIVDGDPVADITAVRRTVLVCKNGRLYDPTALWHALGIRSWHTKPE